MERGDNVVRGMIASVPSTVGFPQDMVVESKRALVYHSMHLGVAINEPIYSFQGFVMVNLRLIDYKVDNTFDLIYRYGDLQLATWLLPSRLGQ